MQQVLKVLCEGGLEKELAQIGKVIKVQYRVQDVLETELYESGLGERRLYLLGWHLEVVVLLLEVLTQQCKELWEWTAGMGPREIMVRENKLRFSLWLTMLKRKSFEMMR